MHLAIGILEYFITHPLEFKYMEQFHNSPFGTDFRRDKLLALDLNRVFRGYGEYFIRLLYWARQRNYRMVEVPAYYILRRHGRSKSRFLAMLFDYTRCALELRSGGKA